MASTLFHQEINRLNMGDILQPDPGFQLEFAVGLTYSLDLEALLGIPISLGMMDDLDSTHRNNPFFLLEAIRKSSDRLAVFCNLGSIKVPQEYRSVFTLLEQSVFEIKLRKDTNFHPKIWFLKYVNKSGNSLIKIITLSRNLTFDRSLDIAVELTGRPTSEENAKKNDDNNPLSELLNFVADHASSTKAKKIRTLANEILNVSNFEGLGQFEKVSFHHFGLKNSVKAETLLADANSLIVISPFLSEGTIDRITKRPKDKILITRKSSLTRKIFDQFKEVYIVKDGMVDLDALEEDVLEATSRRDIHAKIYFKGSASGNYLYLGSLNASENAFHRNIEFMVGLKFKSGVTSFYTVSKDLLQTEPCPFEKLESFDQQLDPESEEISSPLIDVLRSFTGAIVSPDGDRYQIKVICSKPSESVFIRPITSPNAFVKLERETNISGLKLVDLSEFYVINHLQDFAVIKIQTKGIPIFERDNMIYKSVIQDKGGFLAYVTFMLADNYAEVSLEQQIYFERQFLTGEQKQDMIPSALYERLLKSVVTDPKKISEIEEVMNRLDPEVATTELRVMLEMFKTAAKKVKL